MNQSEQWKSTLLALRNCVVSSPTKLARTFDTHIHRTTARYRIQVLENEGHVKGYTPITRPETFGDPYLVKISIDPKQYQFEEDLDTTISSIREFLQQAIGHAPLSVYVYREKNEWKIHCVTLTRTIEKLVDSIYHKENIAKENIDVLALKGVDGIPGYSKFSLREDV